jgi:transposase-like protein
MGYPVGRRPRVGCQPEATERHKNTLRRYKGLHYREVEELLAERGLRAEHVTVWTGVQRYGQEME